LVLAGLGAVGFGSSWYFYELLQQENTRLAFSNPALPGFAERQQGVDDATLPVLVAGGAGAMLSISALPFLLPPASGTPWWAWAIGGLGLVPAGLGVVVLASEGSCIDAEGCTRREQTAVLGSLLLMHASPLISVPFIYLLRSLSGSDAAPQLAFWLGPRGAHALAALFF
jgi:hypothetical protein